MKHIGLFEGIGGFSLAARWAGWETVAWCEWNEFGQRVLRHHFPEAEGFGDITKTDFKKYANRIDIVTGGFPCQPYSAAGKRLGNKDDRHLWPEMFRAIREIQPKWIVGENVLGLVNWSKGLVFEQVQADLEAEGYEVQPYVLPAASVGAPHRRDRVWFVAYAKNYGCKQRREGINGWEEHQFQNRDKVRDIITTNGEESNAPHSNRNGLNQRNGNDEINASKGGQYAQRDIEQGNSNGNAADTDSNQRCKGRMHEAQPKEAERHTSSCHARSNGSRGWHNFPSQSPICSGNDGLSYQLDGITFSKWRKKSIAAYGNAIVIQLAYQIFKAINQYDNKP